MCVCVCVRWCLFFKDKSQVIGSESFDCAFTGSPTSSKDRSLARQVLRWRHGRPSSPSFKGNFNFLVKTNKTVPIKPTGKHNPVWGYPFFWTHCFKWVCLLLRVPSFSGKKVSLKGDTPRSRMGKPFLCVCWGPPMTHPKCELTTLWDRKNGDSCPPLLRSGSLLRCSSPTDSHRNSIGNSLFHPGKLVMQHKAPKEDK